MAERCQAGREFLLAGVMSAQSYLAMKTASRNLTMVTLIRAVHALECGQEKLENRKWKFGIGRRPRWRTERR